MNTRISHLINSTYQVVEVETGDVLFQGSLVNCQAYASLALAKDWD